MENTALHLITFNNDIVKLLLEAGADLNALDAIGNTVLHIASENGVNNIIYLYLEKGVKPNLRNNNGNTALHFATMNDNIDVLYFLLEKGLFI